MDDLPELEKQPLIKLAEEKLRKMAYEQGYVYANVLEDPDEHEDIYLEEIHLISETDDYELTFEINEDLISVFREDQQGNRNVYEISPTGIFEQTIDSQGKIHHRLLLPEKKNSFLTEILNSEPNLKKIKEEFSQAPTSGDMKFLASDRPSIPYTFPFPEE